MTNPQTILANQNASIDVVTDSYKTEQGGAWSLDFIILAACDKSLELTMEVSNDNENWSCFKIIKEKIDRNTGNVFIHNHLPFDYCRWRVTSNSLLGMYKLLFNERR